MSESTAQVEERVKAFQKDCHAIADSFNDPGTYVTGCGFEYATGIIGVDGHNNVFYADDLFRLELMDFESLHEDLAACGGCIAQFNHPDPRYDGNFEDFAFNSGAAPQLFLQEIGNHAQGYVTYEPAFVQSNAAGWKVAPTNNGVAPYTNLLFWLSTSR